MAKAQQDDAPVQQLLSAVPHLEQYAGTWAIEERTFAALLSHVETAARLAEHMAKDRARYEDQKPGSYDLMGSTAVVDMVGGMTKYGSSLSSLYGGTVGVRRSIRQAMADDKVQGILLRIDSPGGSVAGTQDLADDVAAAARQKPVIAYIEDMGASAAYWVASQATEIWATSSAAIGSIGTYAVVDDWSGFYAQKGIRTHVVRAGKYKGAGVRGTEITPEQISEIQRDVEEVNALFLSAVARGRGMDMQDVREVADGRVFVGATAKKHGLIDRVGTLDGAMARLASGRLQSAQARNNASGGPTMGNDVKVAATPAELKAALEPLGADAEFLWSQAEAGATVAEAERAWSIEQRKRLEAAEAKAAEAEAARKAAEAKAAEAEAEAAKASKSERGAAPLGTKGPPEGSASGSADPVAAFEDAVAEKVAAGMSRAEATRAAIREDRDRHAAFVAASPRA